MNWMCTLLALAAWGGERQPEDPPLSLHGDRRQPQVKAILAPLQAKALPAGKLTQEQGEAVFRFAMFADGKLGPPMLGNYERQGNEVIFTPRLPLIPEQRYRVERIADGRTIALEFVVPARKPTPPAEVIKVFPTSGVLPANHLKFYI